MPFQSCCYTATTDLHSSLLVTPVMENCAYNICYSRTWNIVHPKFSTRGYVRWRPSVSSDGHSEYALRPPSLALAARGRSYFLFCWIAISRWVHIQVVPSKDETDSVCYRTGSVSPISLCHRSSTYPDVPLCSTIERLLGIS